MTLFVKTADGGDLYVNIALSITSKFSALFQNINKMKISLWRQRAIHRDDGVKMFS